MPQFDLVTFTSQLFWVFACFILFYLTLTYYVLPSLAVILKVRAHKIQAKPTGDSTITSTTKDWQPLFVASSSLADSNALLSSLSLPVTRPGFYQFTNSWFIAYSASIKLLSSQAAIVASLCALFKR